MGTSTIRKPTIAPSKRRRPRMSHEDPSPIQVRDAAHYKAEVTCLNCGSETEVHPPAGTLVLEFTKEQKMVCPNCACVDARLVVKT
ncbi:hypothetical protein LCGC14_0577690 [marine sediment metagenome]|uniref:Uncharacterized protein n=1 Tax=marine sediment metagenome TaxID=412755 RepID=A0A0F9UQK6_9ZZZZ